MEHQDINIYNTLSRKKELFTPLYPPNIGLYVCGPTVYGHAHLGHARPAITFDIVTRYFRFLGYKVRYVRNITDVGHLEHDADSGEDKIGKLARLQEKEPMEIAQFYANSYHTDMLALGNIPPAIEPLASGHIIEQIKLTEEIIENGYGYVVNGSVYFDVNKYNQSHNYGSLSGHVLDELLAGTRNLDGQEEKRNPSDFALWKKAAPEHIMRWPSPWGDGFPGWHIECSAMSTKYLGNQFDIHGGGMDLLFPHHECEIAQSVAAGKPEPARFWMHCNILTINGQKMGKSLGNGISLYQLFSGDHPLLQQAYSPMTIRFFYLQAHYRSSLDFSNEALQASRKGYMRLMNGMRICRKLKYTVEPALKAKLETELKELLEGCYTAMNDDFNTAILIANLFGILKKLNTWHSNPASLSEVSPELFYEVCNKFQAFITDVLGLKEEEPAQIEGLIQSLLTEYAQAKSEKNYERVDKLRTYFKSAGIQVKDMKTGIDWAYEE